MVTVSFWFRIALALAVFCVVTLVMLVVAVVLWGHRSTSSWYAALVSRTCLAALGLRTAIVGREHLTMHGPCVLVGNHQSSIDVIVFGAVYPPGTVLIGKRSVAWIPFFGLFFLATRNIMINRKNVQAAIAGLDRAVEAVRQRGDTIWIFPEGTRNKGPAALGPFKKGAFHLAIAAQVPVVPICAGPVLRHIDLKTHRIRGPVIDVRVLPPIPTAGLTVADVDSLSMKTHSAMESAVAELFARVP